MKDISLMDEQELVRKAVNALMRDLGPVETTRFLSLVGAKRKDSVKRHRQWQSTLKKEDFFSQIFSSK